MSPIAPLRRRPHLSSSYLRLLLLGLFSLAVLITVKIIQNEQIQERNNDKPRPVVLEDFLTIRRHQSSLPPPPPPQNLIHIATCSKSLLSNNQVKVITAWQELNPAWQVVLYDDDDMLLLVQLEYPEFLTLFNSLLDPVERVDIWRYLIVHSKGGVYSDSDWMPHKPIDEWVKEITTHGLFTGVASSITASPSSSSSSNSKTSSTSYFPKVIVGYEDWKSSFRSLQILQWGFYALETRHPIFYETVKHIQHMFVNEALTSTWQGDAVQRTGPEPFTWAILHHLQRQGVNLSLLERHTLHYSEGDIMIAPVRFFERYGSLAHHGFKGSWKVVPEGKQYWNSDHEWMKDSQEKLVKFRDSYWGGKVGAL